MYEEAEEQSDDQPEAEPELLVESWVRIQQHTFTNWVNDKLRSHLMDIQNLRTDFKDGIKLCKLIESLRDQKIGRVKIKKKLNHYEARGNLQLAFDALAKDRVRLVNIGAEDVSSGNIKLILGLIWTLIRRYQIGSQSKLPPKAMMLSWCNAVLHPYYEVHNFSSDWNDGVALHGLIEYCRPGTCPHWFQMSTSDSVGNCTNGMNLALELFEIPIVIRPEDLSSPDVDELSGMTYLSYFMAENSPGYKATINWVRSKVSPHPVSNFEKDWNNGFVLSHLVTSLGGRIHGWPTIQTDWEIANQMAIDAASTGLDTEPVLSSKDLTNAEVDHIGVMAHAAWLEASTRSKLDDRTVEPTPPPPPPDPEPDMNAGASDSTGPPPYRHDVTVHVKSDWRIDNIMTFDVDTSILGSGSLSAYSQAPSGARLDLPVSRVDQNMHHVEFKPTEKGDWKIFVSYNGEETESSPYDVNVYDPSGAKITRDYGVATQNDTYEFEVDTTQVGLHDVSVYIVHEGKSITHDVTPIGPGKYRVAFTPVERGSYTVAAYSGGIEIPATVYEEERFSSKSSNNDSDEGVDTESYHDVDGGEDVNYATAHAYHEADDENDVIEHAQREIPGDHIARVMVEDRQLHGSPFDVVCKVVEGIFARGAGLAEARPRKEARFEVDTSAYPDGDLKVSVTSPNGGDVRCLVTPTSNDIQEVTYSPMESGTHVISVMYNGSHVPSSPFNVDVIKPRVYIRDLSMYAYMGQKSMFKIDASEMKKGTLEIDTDLPGVSTQKIGQNTYLVTFVPRKPGHHDMVIKYMGEEVEGSPFDVEVKYPGSLRRH